MSRLRAFFADYFGKGPGAPQDADPKYATGLEIPEDGPPQQDAAEKYATGLEIPEGEPRQDADAAPKASVFDRDADPDDPAAVGDQLLEFECRVVVVNKTDVALRLLESRVTPPTQYKSRPEPTIAPKQTSEFTVLATGAVPAFPE